MYTPATRLLTLLHILHANPGLNANDLAERLEVDSRTVRRYVMLLRDLGVQVESDMGQGGGYRLIRGAVLPPSLFSRDELVVLLQALETIDPSESDRQATVESLKLKLNLLLESV
ncbi:MAG: HTH domain-containing protein [Chloroflexi bacterium]|nr:HTH domain-containing protein [Chloroflexota bacterium]